MLWKLRESYEVTFCSTYAGDSGIVQGTSGKANLWATSESRENRQINISFWAIEFTCLLLTQQIQLLNMIYIVAALAVKLILPTQLWWMGGLDQPGRIAERFSSEANT